MRVRARRGDAPYDDGKREAPRTSGSFPKGAAWTTSDDPLASLARLAVRGDSVSENRLVERLVPALRRFLRRTLSREDADDTLQESLLAILTALPEFRGESSLLHFSIGVARRSTQARRRASQRYSERVARAARLELPLMADAEASRDRGLETRRRTELAKLIAELPEVQAHALVLRALFDSSLAEVASGTGTSINTVRTRVRLARQRLRTRIAGDAALRSCSSDEPTLFIPHPPTCLTQR